ncbi:hypothetical protein [Yinghuangia soli]|uniref:Uncharacterized protein n=1 Tax=Yinghuangia soli TaxID=2908204 RepID=A0AA41Q9M5_9ACTN|nr:hypothetical protein [Yinghuangia soli]MCF2532914.1 hypothetical protein [Yinghuangia soli]
MTEPGTPAAAAPAPADALLDAALLEEAAKKSGLLWIAPADGPGAGPARPVWHVWHEGAVHILLARTGEAGAAAASAEQYVPGLAEAAAAEVTLRSKDKGGRLITWSADVAVLDAGHADWAAAAAALHAERLNAPDGEEQPLRWARECVVVRLGAARTVARGAALPSASHAAAPVPTPAGTRGRTPLNLSFGKRLRGR